MGTWRKLSILFGAVLALGVLALLMDNASDNLERQPVVGGECVAHACCADVAGRHTTRMRKRPRRLSRPRNLRFISSLRETSKGTWWSLMRSPERSDLRAGMLMAKVVLVVNVAPHDGRFSLTQFAVDVRHERAYVRRSCRTCTMRMRRRAW